MPLPSGKPKPGLPRFLVIFASFILFAGSLPWDRIPAQAASASETMEKKGVGKRAEGEKGVPATTGPIITDTTIPQSLGTATLFFSTFYAFTGGKFSPGWRRLSAGGDFRSLSTWAQLYLGVAPRMEVYVVLPYLHNWAADVNMPAPTGQRRADFGGLGNVSVTGKYLLSKEGTYLPAMAGIFTAAFPTAHHRHLNPRFLGTDQLGRGAYGFTPGLNFYKHVPPFLLYGNLWYSLFTAATVNRVRYYYPDRLTVNLAVEYPFISNRWVFLGEVLSFCDAGRLIGHRPSQPAATLVSTLVGLEFITGSKWAFVSGVQVDLLGKNTPYNFTPNFSVFYTF